MNKYSKILVVAVTCSVSVMVFATFSSASVDAPDIVGTYLTNLLGTTNARAVNSTFTKGPVGNAGGGTLTGGSSIHGNTPEIKKYIEMARQVHTGWRAAGLGYSQAWTTFNGDRVRTDCSGFCGYALMKAGILDRCDIVSGSDLSSYGFTKYIPQNTDDVQDGDIICWANGEHCAHMQMIVDAKNKRSYNWGSNDGINSVYAGVTDIKNHDPMTSVGSLWSYRHWEPSVSYGVWIWRYTGGKSKGAK